MIKIVVRGVQRWKSLGSRNHRRGFDEEVVVLELPWSLGTGSVLGRQTAGPRVLPPVKSIKKKMFLSCR